MPHTQTQVDSEVARRLLALEATARTLIERHETSISLTEEKFFLDATLALLKIELQKLDRAREDSLRELSYRPGSGTSTATPRASSTKSWKPRSPAKNAMPPNASGTAPTMVSKRKK